MNSTPGIQRAGAPAQQQAAPQQQQQGQAQKSKTPNFFIYEGKGFARVAGKKPSGRGGYSAMLFPTENNGELSVSSTSWKRDNKYPSLEKRIKIENMSVEGTVLTIPLGVIKMDLGDATLANACVAWLTNVQPRARQQRQQGGAGGDE